MNALTAYRNLRRAQCARVLLLGFILLGTAVMTLFLGGLDLDWNNARQLLVQVRLPRLFLEQAELDEEVEMEVGEDQVIIRLVPRPRRNWEKELDGMTARGDDRLLDPKAVSLTAWDEEKWEW